MATDSEIGHVVAVDTAQVSIELNRDLKGMSRSTYEGPQEVGRINSYVVIPVGARRLVAMVTRVVLVEEAEMQVGERHGLLVANVAVSPDFRAASTREKDGEVGVVVDVGIAHAAAVEVKRVIQERPLPFRRGLEFLQKFRKEGNVKLIDPRHLRDLVRMSAGISGFPVIAGRFRLN